MNASIRSVKNKNKNKIRSIRRIIIIGRITIIIKIIRIVLSKKKEIHGVRKKN